MTSRRPTLAVAAALLALAAVPAAAQTPLPADLPWNAPAVVVRARLAALGFAPDTAADAGDSVRVYVAARGGVRATLRARFRERRLFHAYLTAEGDSAALQRELDGRAGALSDAYGGARRTPDGRREWTLPDGRRFALPAAPMRLENGRHGFAASYHRGLVRPVRPGRRGR